MKTTLIHSGSSSSLASLAPGAEISEISSHPGSAEFIFNPPVRQRKAKKKSTTEEVDNGPKKGWFKQKFRKSNVERVLPIFVWAREYTLQKAVADLIAGVTVGLTVLPQALAYATVAGLPPIYGLYSSFVGPLIYIILGGTKAITIGPTAINSILTNKYTYGKSPEYAVFLTFVTGVVCTLMAVFKLGFVANFISSPVISGFTSAVAITIVGTQVKALLGLNFEGEGFLPTAKGVIKHFNEIKMGDAILSLICCSVLLTLKFLQPIMRCVGCKSQGMDKVFWLISTARSALVIFFAAIYAYWVVDPPFEIVRNIPPGIPAFKPPPFTIYEPADNKTHYFTDILNEEASALVVLPLLAIMGHVTIAKAFAGTSRVDATQETLCIGISNLIGCFFSNYPIGGSFSRTTVNAMSGVASPLGGVYTGVMVLLALQFLTPYFYFIPKASLASVITCCVAFMVDPWILMPMWRSKKMDLIPLTLTFFVTLFVGLEFGIGIGLISSTLYLLYYSARPKVNILQGESSTGTRFVLVELDRSLTFPSVDYITYEITKAGLRFANSKTPIVVDCHHIQFADYTAGEGMRDLVLRLNHNGLKVIFWKMKPSILRILVGVMSGTGARFIHCDTEAQVENLVDGVSGVSPRIEITVGDS
ncbi:unnamed protein product [Orchesella dallaii]|uniref:STAS domain-containing protein n=1 Tax=Orchesella dallaii TaxID=48710 RepID=A0ABP1PQQ8_9HEXA